MDERMNRVVRVWTHHDFRFAHDPVRFFGYETTSGRKGSVRAKDELDAWIKAEAKVAEAIERGWEW